MAEYSKYNDFNRFPNLDCIPAKIVKHLVDSNSKHAENLWKLLKYNDVNALTQGENLSQSERQDLIFHDNGQTTDKRVFFAPFVDDAWQEQCSSIYIYVDQIYPVTQGNAVVGVKVEIVVHSKISTINGDGDPDLNPKANPADSEEGNVVVAFKNRATVLLKSVLAELNGLTLDGIGFLQFNTRLFSDSQVKCNLWNNKTFWGYTITFGINMSGLADNPNHSY